MTIKIQQINILSLVKFLTVLNAGMGFLIGLVVSALALTGSDEESFMGLGAWAILVLPVINAVFGSVSAVVLGYGYNLCASVFGGIEIETDQEPEALKLRAISV